MSAIAGVLGANGRSVDPRIVQHMLDAMPGRGLDGTRLFHGSGIALGHANLRTLPETHSATLPLVLGDLALTADARLDNRDELIAALRPAEEPSDAALVLNAYLRWGEECPGHLLGDFAFALWDAGRKRLFCARDHFGVKPFYYSVSGGDVAFASEIKALLALPNESQSIDEARIADFLVALPPDGQSTFYEGIVSLPAAHSLSISRTSRRLRRYWQLELSAASTGTDCAEQFHDLFATAIRCRLRSAGPVGAPLSGGLDSSSIACMAAPMVARDQGRPLPTFSIVFDETPAWSERPFIECVLAQGGFDPTFVHADGYAPFENFDGILAEQDGAFPAPGLAVSRTLYHAAADRGVRVLLDGHGGDEVVSHGEGRLIELAHAHRWIALWGEVRGLAAIYGNAAWPLFATHVERYGPARHLRPVRRLAARALRRLRARDPGAPARSGALAFVNPDLAARTDLAARYREKALADAAAMTSEGERHLHQLASPMIASGFEVLDKAAAAAGVEPRYPFWDKRLVEFCLGLQSSEKLNGGWSRLILRRAMQGVLPPAIQWRRDKLDFSPHVVRGMLAHHGALLDTIVVDDTDGVGRYVDLPVVAAAYGRIRDRKEAANGMDVQMVWRTTALSLWLRRLQNAPPSAIAAA